MKYSILAVSAKRFGSLLLPLNFFILLLLFASSCRSDKESYTKGIGIYPGAVAENYAPSLKINNTAYRNIALHRPAWHSSSFDYNLTAQLITDGIIDTLEPLSYKLESSQSGLIPKNEKGYLFDQNIMTGIQIEGPEAWVSFELSNKEVLDPVDSIIFGGSLLVDETNSGGWKFKISGSDDGENWETIKTINGKGYPGDSIPKEWREFLPSNMRIFKEPITLNREIRYSNYRLEAKFAGAISWNIVDFTLLNNTRRIKIGGPFLFTSAWKSAGNTDEWVYVDLGADCQIDSLALHWINPALVAQIEISSNAVEWDVIQTLKKNSKLENNLKLEAEVKARYVRISMIEALNDNPYILSELEVYGKGAPIVVPKPPPLPDEDDQLTLAGGKWRVQRASLVADPGTVLSIAGYDVSSWLVATVPGTVLMSYHNAGAVPDPNFGDNQLMISESFFYSDFWYWNEFYVPASYKGQNIYLNFDGINWKAEVFLNGEQIGTIEGAFMRGKFDVTEKIEHGRRNIIAVKIIKNDSPGYAKEQTKYHPGKNGGELGGDNPTFHASVGWDWIPSIRGRNIGIWNDVYLNTKGAVRIENPFLSYDLPLPDTSYANVLLKLNLVNSSDEAVSGDLLCKIGPLNFKFPFEIGANSTIAMNLNPLVIPELKWKKPQLWWPNGYGKPHLYDVKLTVKTSGKRISDSKSFKTGVREMSYTETGGILKTYINGKRFSGRGGNWGFSESNLRYRAREYDIAVGYHRDMNFTMIRNWVGQTGDEEFYEACDKYGIMIWQDFWLANPVDGPDPFDNELFMANANDYLLKIRNHPSLALYCGRNEGNPPPELDAELRNLVKEYHPGLHYISHSATGGVSGFGPYRAMPISYYFEERALPKIHSEMGMPNMVNIESLEQMMPDSALWPQERMWGLHDFCLNGAQGGASFKKQIEEAFGPVDNVEDWVELAQWINYRGYRAMFEAQSKYRMGLQLWMSHPAWPSLVWQTYDYYFDPTAAYFGCKKASAPLHILWNAATDSIEVMNTSFTEGEGLTAQIEVLNLDGSLKYEETIELDSPEDSRQLLAAHPYPEGRSDVYFLRLKILKNKKLLAENLYWRAASEEDYSAIIAVPDIDLELKTSSHEKDGQWQLTTKVTNNSEHPALMARLQVVGRSSGKRILPVLYSDNYLTILPGESREIGMQFKEEDTRDEKPIVIVKGLNIN